MCAPCRAPDRRSRCNNCLRKGGLTRGDTPPWAQAAKLERLNMVAGDGQRKVYPTVLQVFGAGLTREARCEG